MGLPAQARLRIERAPAAPAGPLAAGIAGARPVTTSRQLQRLIAPLHADAETTAEQVFDQVWHGIPEYRNGTHGHDAAEIHEHCLLGTRVWHQSLRDRRPPPTEALEQLARIGAYKCRIGMPLGSVMQAFRVGSMLFWEQLVALSHEHDGVRDELLSKVSLFFLQHFDQVGEAVSRGYHAEQRRTPRRDIAPLPPRPVFAEPLTERERTVLRLLCAGRSNGEIAEHIRISQNTVKYHLKAIYGKLGVHRRTEAAAMAQQLGL
ncbi:response regulator transcription factor [Algiphilus sp.]|uniref:response regulator transcription factor n=1 Tax=Algiphilus sp. TaxID=1872431 RepID=UPI0025C6F951|nr:response regulator transcription factor [Algiphilus sp.]